MTNLKITASHYQDPLFNQLRKQVEACNDHYPALMLPVRLETRFMKEQRYIMQQDPAEIERNRLLDMLQDRVYDLILANRRKGEHIPININLLLQQIIASVDDITAELRDQHEITRVDRDNFRDAFRSLERETDGAMFNGEPQNTALLKSLQQAISRGLKALYDIPLPPHPTHQPGLNALKELEQLESAMNSLYGTNPIQASHLDKTIEKVEGHIKGFMEIMEQPDLMATHATISAISSKISFIKRRHKKSSCSLTRFKTAYPGNKDLQREEYRLRHEINDLKVRVDEDYTQYMELLVSLKKIPIRRLAYLICEAAAWLEAANDAGYATADQLLAERSNLYRRLRRIRQHAHTPLLGAYNDIDRLKRNYDHLEREILRYIEASQKVTPLNRAHRVGLSRLNTHLTNEYLEDLKPLRAGDSHTEAQIFSNDKIRHTAAAARKTIQQITTAKNTLKKTRMGAENAMIFASNLLEELVKNLTVSTTNTILVPEQKHKQILSTFQSLNSHVSNYYDNNNVSTNHVLKGSINNSLKTIKSLLDDQHCDVFDYPDPFYDEFRKRITFIIPGEVINELWVRIFPDDIAIDNHDEQISDNELAVGKAYYDEVYSHAADERSEAMLPAWRAAAASIGPRRAAWVIQEILHDEVAKREILDPTNYLQPLATQLLRIFSAPRKQWRGQKEAENAAWVIALKEALSNTLTEHYFTPCLRTKPSVTSIMETLQRGIGQYNALITGKRGTRQDLMKTELESLIESYKLVTSYAVQHRTALNLPYDPGFNFENIETKPAEWCRPAITEVMPDRFVVVTKRNDVFRQIKVGRQIPDTLQVGIAPTDMEADQFFQLPGGDLNVPENIRWMYDFHAAVEQGMAVRIPLQKDDFEKGFDLVMAYGISTHGDTPASEKHEVGQKAINKLFTGHLYSDGGLEYLPVGTATNNTDHVKSPYETLDGDYDGLFDLFINPKEQHGNLVYNVNNEMNISDGQFFRDALGLPNKVAELIRHHSKTDIVQSRAMSRLLYGATLGFTMRFMFENLFNTNDMSHVRPFMMQHVSAVGNLPSFRIDNQPYGCLPITLHRKLWVHENTEKGTYGSFLHKLSMFLNATRVIFEKKMTGKVKTINHPSYTNDPQKAFLEILGLEPYSRDFGFRDGANVANRWGRLENLGKEIVELIDSINWRKDQAECPASVASHFEYLLTKRGFSSPATRERGLSKTRMFSARFINMNDIMGPLVQYPGHGRGLLKPVFDNESKNYIEYLRSLAPVPRNLLDIRPEQMDDAGCNTLLFELARFSLLYDNSVYALRAADNVSGLEVSLLERLMAGHIDLCSYRIDAWLSGLADYRMRELRKDHPSGSFIGAYGFVEKLRKGAERTRVQHFPEGLEPTDGTEVYKVADNQGFIHGSSLNYAVTAAVLRAGYNSQKEQEGGNSPFAINLSASRVREGLKLLEGITGGQETGALLGYQLERALHEQYKGPNGEHLEMDALIYRLRRKFPTYSDRLIDEATEGQQQESIRAMNVVDGLAMLDHFENHLQNENPQLWDDDKTYVEMLVTGSFESPAFQGYPWGLQEALPPITSTGGAADPLKNKWVIRAVIHELDHMADALDAMADLVTSEGVYQMVRGNYTRANAVLNAMRDGRIPPSPEILRSMREGTMVNHKVVITLPHQPDEHPWNHLEATPLASAEPGINGWLAKQLGAPGKTGWEVQYPLHNEQHLVYLTLDDLELQPYDLVMLTGHGDDGVDELKARSVRAAISKGAPADAHFSVNFGICPPKADRSLNECLSLMNHLAKVISVIRPADARDFEYEESSLRPELETPGLDTVELFGRLSAAATAYTHLLEELESFGTPSPDDNNSHQQAVEFNIKLTQWGFHQYYPLPGEMTDTQSLVSKIVSARERVALNIQEVDALLHKMALEPDHAVWLQLTEEVCTLLFGQGAKVIPKVKVSEVEAIKEMAAEPHHTGILRNLPDDYLEQWLGDVAMVRKNIASFDTVCLLKEVMEGTRPLLSVVQLPVLEIEGEPDYWLGGEHPGSWSPEEDRLSLVITGTEEMQEYTSALVLDEWMEIIPEQEQTTGVAFHYNQPDARPPQSLLLAVSPKLNGKWSLDELGLIVEEAYLMARLRAVEPELINNTPLAHILPAATLLADGDDEAARNIFRFGFDWKDDGQKGMMADLSVINKGYVPDEVKEEEL